MHFSNKDEPEGFDSEYEISPTKEKFTEREPSDKFTSSRAWFIKYYPGGPHGEKPGCVLREVIRTVVDESDFIPVLKLHNLCNPGLNSTIAGENLSEFTTAKFSSVLNKFTGYRYHFHQSRQSLITFGHHQKHFERKNSW